MFISFEGPDGGGKSTQIRLLADYLTTQGRIVTATREPGGTPIGDQAREIVHSLKNTGMDARTEFLLYAASRSQLVSEVIRPALARGHIVLVDRYIDSTFAYQGYGRGLNLDTLRLITGFATGGLLPDLTIYLDIDPGVALERRQQAATGGEEWNRMDAQTLDFYQRVRAGYEQLIAADPGRWVCVDGAQDVAAVQESIRAAVLPALIA